MCCVPASGTVRARGFLVLCVAQATYTDRVEHGAIVSARTRAHARTLPKEMIWIRGEMCWILECIVA
ncbi:hypothetical protein NDU88_004448 [Pleurodeles waltl]|uniref:Secreted protein n=1 Tax=Pleurodeles waltl TaxID=8319 RepID=A0AAV7QC01_PLEWA|nr:hypothetical protein NDU88_004448 [Pleurodeles waltl]